MMGDFMPLLAFPDAVRLNILEELPSLPHTLRRWICASRTDMGGAPPCSVHSLPWLVLLRLTYAVLPGRCLLPLLRFVAPLRCGITQNFVVLPCYAIRLERYLQDAALLVRRCAQRAALRWMLVFAGAERRVACYSALISPAFRRWSCCALFSSRYHLSPVTIPIRVCLSVFFLGWVRRCWVPVSCLPGRRRVPSVYGDSCCILLPTLPLPS